jgi:hypothetical protein
VRTPLIGVVRDRSRGSFDSAPKSGRYAQEEQGMEFEGLGRIAKIAIIAKSEEGGIHARCQRWRSRSFSLPAFRMAIKNKKTGHSKFGTTRVAGCRKNSGFEAV